MTTTQFDIELDLPYPPTMNTYLRMQRGRMVKTSTARLYQETVGVLVWEKYGHPKPLAGDVSLELEFFQPRDKRRHCDIDNLFKVLIDALTDARLWHDDKQVKHIEATINPNTTEDGLAKVRVAGL